MKAIANFLENVLPKTPSSIPKHMAVKKTPPPPRRFGVGTQTVVASEETVAIHSTSAVHETAKFSFDSTDDDDDFVEEDARAFGTDNIGPTASPYILAYLYNRRSLDTQYGIRKDGYAFKIGGSSVLVDTDSDMTIKGREFKGTTGLWELLTRKKVERNKIMVDDLKKYNRISELNNVYLTDYQPGADMQITRESKYRDDIAYKATSYRNRDMTPVAK